MINLLPLLPALACLAMMFGAGASMWLGTKTPLRHVRAIARRGQSRPDGQSHASRG